MASGATSREENQLSGHEASQLRTAGRPGPSSGRLGRTRVPEGGPTEPSGVAS